MKTMIAQTTKESCGYDGVIMRVPADSVVIVKANMVRRKGLENKKRQANGTRGFEKGGNPFASRRSPPFLGKRQLQTTGV
ncbi:hypothetical protein CVT26_012531 [Gymnopilus dilepis]|uniref:Uncharacterized protein n=1 Tax=Gymnopilus dilepis TaxID=231916 RepID=A0A409WAL9_9AGAR|nr:hypothetical protein CVT26_012531 [Gymnopilus dilepis]